jgi:hypothetical protein
MERGFGGGQPCGLAAALQNITDLHSEALRIELVLPHSQKAYENTILSQGVS